METYIQVHFSDLLPEAHEILIAQLSEAGYEGFEQGINFLNACIPQSKFDASALNEIADPNVYKTQITAIEARNWNEEWESSFEPVIIDDFCAIRASFHPTVIGVEHEIIITPKMSFGTGHHATTSQVVQLMRRVDFSGKDVFDFGTGTGVLAILAEKLGAKEVLAMDIDEWSIENASENIDANNCSKVKLLHASEIPSHQTFDVILANINRHVILNELPAMAKQLRKCGVLILSGLLKDDLATIMDAALKQHLIVQTHSQKHDWIAMRFTNC